MKKIVLLIVGVILFVLLFNFLIMPLTGSYDRVKPVESYSGENAYIKFDTPEGLYLSAARAGGDLEPEETMAAFKLCMSDAIDYKVDVLEFDFAALAFPATFTSTTVIECAFASYEKMYSTSLSWLNTLHC